MIWVSEEEREGGECEDEDEDEVIATSFPP